MATTAAETETNDTTGKRTTGVTKGRKSANSKGVRPRQKPKRLTAPHLGLAAVPTIASFEVKVTIYAILSQKIVERSFEQVQRDIWLLTVKLATLGFAKEARAAEELFIRELQEIEEKQARMLEEYDAKLDDSGITEMASYGDGTVFTLQITTPLSRRFITAVQQCDVIMQRIDALWLHGAIPGHEGNDMRYAARGGLMKLSNRLRQNANMMRGAISRGELTEEKEAASEPLPEEVTDQHAAAPEPLAEEAVKE